MKTYSVEIYKGNRHGQYKSEYTGIAVWTIEANSKKEAREKALDAMIGKKASEYNFPIDYSHAPEATKEEMNGVVCYTMKYLDSLNHLINEFDIAQKGIIVVDVTEIK